MSGDISQHILDQVNDALNAKEAVSIHGAGSHAFLLHDFRETRQLDLAGHSGILEYHPSELTLKARAGTPIAEIQQELARHNQRLATDIPVFSDTATLGGALAIGHSGPGRPFLGALRDHVLGASLINGHGKLIHCGGQVMKNVAGYDISRLLAGSRGTLGPILDITVKVLPMPQTQLTLAFDMEENPAIETMNRLAGRSLPLSAAVFHRGKLLLRLEGSESGVGSARKSLDATEINDSEAFWQSLCNQQHEFFNSAQNLWRVIVPSTTPRLELERRHECLIDWCGGLRWIQSEEITQSDFIHVSNCGGYIENYRGGRPTHPAELMNDLQKQMHNRIKSAFDPHNIFNATLAKF